MAELNYKHFSPLSNMENLTKSYCRNLSNPKGVKYNINIDDR